MNHNLLRKPLFLLAVAFVISVLLRLPNLDRPISKHHEFNTAVILNGIISWKEAGGGTVFYYVPLMTYQGAENRLLERGPYTDANGNQVYLSLGPGWYMLPYLVMNLFGMPVTPLSLQIINLVIHLLVVITLYRLMLVIAKRYSFLSPDLPLFACLVFLFMPGPLWYFGNGYVHAAISLPFALLLITQFLKWAFLQSRLTIYNAFIFLMYGIAGIYMDWFSFFLLSVLGVTAVVFYIKLRKPYWLTIALLCAATAGIAIAAIFLQFASLLGWKNVLQYWTERVDARGLNNEDTSLLKNLLAIATNIATCAGIVVVCMVLTIAAYFKNRQKPFPLLPCLLWALACLCYNGVFFNWSYVHEFSMVPLCVLLSIITAFFILHILPKKRAWTAFTILLIINMGQYYYMNPAGNISRVGTPYKAQQQLGENIKKMVPPGYRIFSTLSNDPMVEYYAHRSFTFHIKLNPDSAQIICNRFHISKAVWLKIDSLKIKETHWLK